MRLGCVVRTLDQAVAAQALDLDYLEVTGDLLWGDDGSAGRLIQRINALETPPRAMTSPLPRRLGIRLVGPSADHDSGLEVMVRLLDLAAAVGVRTVAFGSGQARHVPDGVTAEAAFAQFAAFARRAAGAAHDRGLILALEPLNSSETNLLTSCREAREMVDEVAHPAFAMLADCFHIVREGLDIGTELEAAGGALVHAHTSPIPRGTKNLRLADQRAFLRGLLSLGYAGGVTIEDDFPAFDVDAPAITSRFRELLDELGSG